MYSNKHFINSIMDAGAAMVISKDTLYQEILYAIQSVMAKAED
jgi:DNA-binding NarL/FixJ family response regulator